VKTFGITKKAKSLRWLIFEGTDTRKIGAASPMELPNRGERPTHEGCVAKIFKLIKKNVCYHRTKVKRVKDVLVFSKEFVFAATTRSFLMSLKIFATQPSLPYHLGSRRSTGCLLA